MITYAAARESNALRGGLDYKPHEHHKHSHALLSAFARAIWLYFFAGDCCTQIKVSGLECLSSAREVCCGGNVPVHTGPLPA